MLYAELIQDPKRYLMYLRKSRQDDPNETVEEVLNKHETALQEHALREIGGAIPEENIYREVVSGERIDDREEFQRVLARIEDPNIVGVFAADSARLSRGDLGDCDRVMKGFQFTDTLIITLKMTYDLKDKRERKFLQQEMMMNADFLDYTKDIMRRGRELAAKRGNFSQSAPPYGYNKIKIGKDWTLEPNEDADIVRLIFDLYVHNGMTPGMIAKQLNDMGVPTPKGGQWRYERIAHLLRNPHYIGKIRFNYRKATPVMENGERVVKRLMQPEEEVILAEGKHPAIVDPEVFEAAQERRLSNPRLALDRSLKNWLAGTLYCKNCGRAMERKPKARDGAHERVQCPQTPVCYKGVILEDIYEAVIYTLEHVELPNLQSKLENGDGDAVVIQKRRLEKLNKQMEDYRQRKEDLFEFLETKVYTKEVFLTRSKALQEKMDACEKEIHKTREAMPKSVDYGKHIVTLQTAIAALKDPEMSIEEKNRLLRAAVKRIEYSSVKLTRGETDIQLDVYLRL